MTQAELVNFISMLTGIVQLVVTGVLAWIVHRSTRTLSRLDFARSVRDSWMTLDSIALSNPDTLRVGDTLLRAPGDRAPSLDFARKRWFALAYLNPINTTWQGVNEGLYGDRGAEVLGTVRVQLETLLRDDDVFWMTQNHGHDPSFEAYCRKIHDEIVAKRGTAASPRT